MLVFFSVSPSQPKLPVSLANVIDKAVKAINFIKSQLLHACLFNILSSEMRSNHKALMQYLKVQWMFLIVSKKAFWDWDTTELAAFFHITPFYFKEPLTNYCYSDVIQMWVFDRHFLENKWSESVTSRNPLLVFIITFFFLTKDKIQAFRQKLEFWKLVSATMNWKASPY